MFRRLIVILALLCLPSLAIAADVPYTGNLFESGTPVNGTRTINLAVYNVASGGSPLYTQAAPLDVSNGVFHTVLVVPDGVWFGGDRWIGVSVNGGGELSPRVKYYAPPRPMPVFVSRPATSLFVNAAQWTKVDSITINSLTSGVTSISLLGFAQRTENPASSMQLAISETTPTSPQTLVVSDGPSMPVCMPYQTATTPGTHTYYFWCKVLAAGSQYIVYSQHFSALYLPN